MTVERMAGDLFSGAHSRFAQLQPSVHERTASTTQRVRSGRANASFACTGPQGTGSIPSVHPGSPEEHQVLFSPHTSTTTPSTAGLSRGTVKHPHTAVACPPLLITCWWLNYRMPWRSWGALPPPGWTYCTRMSTTQLGSYGEHLWQSRHWPLLMQDWRRYQIGKRTENGVPFVMHVPAGRRGSVTPRPWTGGSGHYLPTCESAVEPEHTKVRWTLLHTAPQLS